MSEINPIPDIEPHEEVDLARQLNSLLAAQLGHADDPAAALQLMLNALEARVQLPQVQAQVRALEAQAQALMAKIPPLEAELAQSHRFEMMLAREAGTEVRDEMVGFVCAAVATHKTLYPSLLQRADEQWKELADLRAKYAEFDPVMVVFAEALGKADAREIERVARDALDARAEREANHARMLELERENDLRKLDVILDRGKNEGRLTPFGENNIRQGFAQGKLALDAIDLMVDSMPPIAAFKHKEPPRPGQASPSLQWEGKTWAQMQPLERANLHRDHPQIYADMRHAATGEG